MISKYKSELLGANRIAANSEAVLDLTLRHGWQGLTCLANHLILFRNHRETILKTTG